MQTINKKPSLISKILVTSATTYILLFSILSLTKPTSTVNDSALVLNNLARPSDRQVLGASLISRNQEEVSGLYGCSINEPIIGWIDFEGRKVIKDTLPDNQTASNCFATVQEANNHGFYFLED